MSARGGVWAFGYYTLLCLPVHIYSTSIRAISSGVFVIDFVERHNNVAEIGNCSSAIQVNLLYLKTA